MIHNYRKSTQKLFWEISLFKVEIRLNTINKLIEILAFIPFKSIPN